MLVAVFLSLILLRRSCQAIIFIDLPIGQRDLNDSYPPVRDERRSYNDPEIYQKPYEDEKDLDIKIKIGTLVDQTMSDTEKRMDVVNKLKELLRSRLPYKIGFIISMINKSKYMMSELFNVAVKNKDEWKALEQLKVFEMIIHTDLDTTNLVRQLTETHLQNMELDNPTAGKRVVLMK